MAETAFKSKTLDSLIALRDGLVRRDSAARLTALGLCQELQLELETPGETLFRTVLAQPVHHWTLFAAVLDLDIMEQLTEGNDAPKTSTELARRKNADPVMIGRIMRQLAAMGTVSETGPDTFAHNRFSRFLTTESARATLTFMRKWQVVIMQIPEYLAYHSFQSPTDIKNSPTMFTYQMQDSTFFDWLASDSKHGPAFAGMMKAEKEGKPTWSDEQLYPVKQKLRDVEDPNGVLVVDIGGGGGHDLAWFRKNHPNIKGRLILQDLPYIADSVSLEGIESMAHNFYDEQPVKGAQVYFLHQIMHDYDDDKCIRILRAILPAMKKGYSRILLNDLVLPDQGAHWFATTVDLQVMAALSARERTQAQFVGLIEKVGGGLKIEKIWTPSGSGMMDSIVECVIG